MRPGSTMKFILAGLVLGLALQAQPLFACAACYAKLNEPSPLAEGMNWGIFSLLGVIVCVLGGIATFAIFLAKRSAMISASADAGQSLKVTQELT
jgi:hypothetical protein